MVYDEEEDNYPRGGGLITLSIGAVGGFIVGLLVGALFIGCNLHVEKPIQMVDGVLQVDLCALYPDGAEIDIQDIYGKAAEMGLIPETDASRCSGPGSCSVQCGNYTFTVSGFSELCSCESMPGHGLTVSCDPPECVDVHFTCPS